jgi:hypothetical protein
MVGWSMTEGAPQHRPTGREDRRALVVEAELQQGLGDGGMSAGSAGSSRSMMPLPANPATEELPTCSAGVAGHLVAMRAMSRLATSGAAGSAWWTSTGARR